VNTPLEECEARDVKGLYKKAREGKIKGELLKIEIYKKVEKRQFLNLKILFLNIFSMGMLSKK